jgi:hypothetical protein
MLLVLLLLLFFPNLRLHFQMLGSYGPSPDGKPYERTFHTEQSPSGIIARSGTYDVRSRFVDDDGTVYSGEMADLSSTMASRVELVVLTRLMRLNAARLSLDLQDRERVVTSDSGSLLGYDIYRAPPLPMLHSFKANVVMIFCGLPVNLIIRR